MKKFLKAVALATVMCMLLSVSAFAHTYQPDTDADSIAVTVNAGANEEVALLVVAAGTQLSGLEDEDIEYIGQVTANGSGVANFGTFKVKNADAKVDIYAGSTTLETATPIATNVDLKGVTGITIVEDSTITATAAGPAGEEYGFAAALTVNVPDSLTISKMIWAFLLEGESDWRYSTSIANPAGADVVSGGVQFAAAFDAFTGDKAAGTTAQAVVAKVAAIFLTTDDAEHVVGTTDNLLDDRRVVTPVED